MFWRKKKQTIDVTKLDAGVAIRKNDLLDKAMEISDLLIKKKQTIGLEIPTCLYNYTKQEIYANAIAALSVQLMTKYGMTAEEVDEYFMSIVSKFSKRR